MSAHVDHWTPVSIDKCHASLIYGTAVSLKPTTILELGIGAGFITKMLLSAIEYNRIGSLTSVDNWHDWNGNEPGHIAELRKRGCNVVVAEERNFVISCRAKYDLIVVDGNHRQGGEWADKVIKMLSSGGILFAHDVDMEQYAGLKRYEVLAKQLGLTYLKFNRNSLDDEMCNRGLAMIGMP